MSTYSGVTAMRVVGGGTPVLDPERENMDTPTMFTVSIADELVSLDRRAEALGVVRQEKGEEGQRVDAEKRLIQLIVDEGMSQTKAAEMTGYAKSSVYAILQRARQRGEIVQVDRGVYARPGQEAQALAKDQEAATGEDAPPAGPTSEQVQDMVGRAVAEAVKPLIESLADLEDKHIAIAQAVGKLEAERVPQLVASFNDRLGDLDKAVSAQEAMISKEAAGWRTRYNQLREELTLASRAIGALEADVEELQETKGAGAPSSQGDVVALALRLLAAERGLTA